MRTVYVETTIPSYLAGYPSRDLIIAAHQQITHDWWRTARNRFDLYVSEAVWDEIHAGDPEAAKRRLKIIDGLPILAFSEDIKTLVEAYDSRLGLVGRARADLVHLAFAVAYGMDYVVTWNCRHLANGETIRRLRDANQDLSRPTPIIVTPEELFETEAHTMIDDPIVEEVYQARQRILDKWQGDLGKWLEHLRDCESPHTGRVVNLETMRATNDRQPTGADVVAYWEREGVIGARSDIADPAEHARDLRKQAETRERS